MQDISLERRRDGAYAWHIFEDPDEDGKVIETYLIHSALELKYRQARVTMADQIMEEEADAVSEGAGGDPISGCAATPPPAMAEAHPPAARRLLRRA